MTDGGVGIRYIAREDWHDTQFTHSTKLRTSITGIHSCLHAIITYMWVKTFTSFAVFVVVVRAATIATIPIARAIVVSIVACFIALPFAVKTFSR